MQINTLNRVIALFLVGSFMVVLAIFVFRGKIDGYLDTHPNAKALSPAAATLVAVGLLPVTALLGVIVDAFGNLTVRRGIKRLLFERRTGARLFFCAREFDEKEEWKKLFREGLIQSERYKLLRGRLDLLSPLSAGLFFRTAKREHNEWLVQHLSMYHLSANFVIIAMLGFVLALYRCSAGLAIASFLTGYLLMIFALDQFLYCYQIAFRNAVLELIQTEGKSEPDTAALEGK